ncbi:42431_t:CDS:1, partial [Gigaspora margarita]
EFFNQVCCHYQYPFIDILPEPELINTIEQSIALADNVDIEYEPNCQNIEDTQACEKLYAQLIEVTEQALEILKDQ